MRASIGLNFEAVNTTGHDRQRAPVHNFFFFFSCQIRSTASNRSPPRSPLPPHGFDRSFTNNTLLRTAGHKASTTFPRINFIVGFYLAIHGRNNRAGAFISLAQRRTYRCDLLQPRGLAVRGEVGLTHYLRST